MIIFLLSHCKVNFTWWNTDVECYLISLCSISFWNNAGETYKIDLSALRPYAQHCLSRCMRIYSLAGENVMAREKEICRVDLDTLDPLQLKNITVCAQSLACCSCFLLDVFNVTFV